MTFAFVFALPWVLFGLAFFACGITRSLFRAVSAWLRRKKKDR